MAKEKSKKLEIIYGNREIDYSLKKEYYHLFGIDIVSILDDIFNLDKRKDLEYQDIKYQIEIVNNLDMQKVIEPNYLHVVIDDYMIKKDKLIYIDVTVKESFKNSKYILYFDLDNNKVIVEENKKIGANNIYEYKIRNEKVTRQLGDFTTGSTGRLFMINIDKNQNLSVIKGPNKSFKTSRAILKKEIFKNRFDDTKLIKFHTYKGNRALIIKEDNKEYSVFKYYFSNNIISSYITLKVENKESIRSYSYVDFETKETYYKKFQVQDIVDSYITSLVNDKIESSLSLYDKIKSSFKNIPDEFKYELEIKTQNKDLNELREEMLIDNNGVICVQMNEKIKKKIKK